MSRVESSDDRRIRELNEEAYRRKVDNLKRDQQARTSRTFTEVMDQKAKTERSQRTSEERAAHTHRERVAKEAVKHRKQPSSRAHQEMLRKSALQRGIQGKMESLRQQSARAQSEVMAERGTGFLAEARSERERLTAVDRREREHDADLEQDKQAELQEELQRDLRDPIDGHRHHSPGQRDRSGGDEDGRDPAQAVAAVQTPTKPRAAPEIPPETLQEVVKAMFAAAKEDGRTRLIVELKGKGLEGVRLEVRQENHEIQCTFTGCSPRMRQSLQAAQPRLEAQLGKRGLKLGRLNFG